MSEFTTTAVGSLDRFVPAGSVKLYNYNGADGMTLAQAIMAMAFKRTAQLEAESVLIMNMMNKNTEKLEKLSAYAQAVTPLGVDATVKSEVWNPIRDYLINTCGVPSGNLPGSGALNSFSSIMSAYKVIEEKLKEYNTTSDTLGIELQTQATYRDSYFTMSINMTTHLGKSQLSSAAALNGK